MRKRKNEEGYEAGPKSLPFVGPGHYFGLLLLLLATLTGTGHWLRNGPVEPTPGLLAPVLSTPSRAEATRAPIRTSRPASGAAEAPLPTDALLVVSNAAGELLGNRGGSFGALAHQGVDVAAAPISGALAYRHEERLYVLQGTVEQQIGLPGQMPAWSADGRTLTFVTPEAGSYAVYRVALGATPDAPLRPARLMAVAQIVAPALISPATERFLIVERLTSRQTAFYTIDPYCMGDAACRATRQDIGTVNYAVTWADYHPSATAIVFSESGGGLYLLSTATGETQPLETRVRFAHRPAFSPEGNRLAFLGASGQPYVFDLSSQALSVASITGVQSLDWLTVTTG